MQTPSESFGLAPDNPATLKYLDMLQGASTRMAANSSNCKAWCITIVSALLAVAFKDTGMSGGREASLALVPWILFFVLDSYYLSLERDFRRRFNRAVELIRSNGLTEDELFVIAPGVGTHGRLASVVRVMFGSATTYPFYLLMGVLIAGAVIVRM